MKEKILYMINGSKKTIKHEEVEIKIRKKTTSTE